MTCIRSHSPSNGRMRLKPRSTLLTSVPTGKNFRPWQAGGTDTFDLVDLLAFVTICWLLFTALSLALRQTIFQLDLNQGCYTNEEIDIDFEPRILRVDNLYLLKSSKWSILVSSPHNNPVQGRQLHSEIWKQVLKWAEGY